MNVEKVLAQQKKPQQVLMKPEELKKFSVILPFSIKYVLNVWKWFEFKMSFLLIEGPQKFFQEPNR